jgi:hypothetical protein
MFRSLKPEKIIRLREDVSNTSAFHLHVIQYPYFYSPFLLSYRSFEGAFKGTCAKGVIKPPLVTQISKYYTRVLRIGQRSSSRMVLETTYPSQRRDQGEVFKDFATLTLTHIVTQIQHHLCKGYLRRRNVGVGVDRAEANEIKKASESIHVIGEDQGVGK